MRPFTLKINGHLHEYSSPAVMGILNLTPDSFYSGSRTLDYGEIKGRVEKMVAEGADFIDVGAYSTRPGCDDVDVNEELRRLELGMEALRAVDPDIPVSVDTFRSEVAMRAVKDLSVNIINDISGGDMDPRMYETVACLQVPYILMHMRGTPQTMLEDTDYDNLVQDILENLAKKVTALSLLNVNDVIIDPGFGFSKTLEQNYMLLSHLSLFSIFGLPLLVGVSRKSMITKLLDVPAKDALNGTTALNMLSLERGASILRVHDVASAKEAVKIYTMTLNHQRCIVVDR